MSLYQLCCVAAMALLVCVVSSYTGWVTALICAYLLTLGGVTTTLFIWGTSNVHYGIAPSAPTFWLGDVLLVLAVVAIWATGSSWGTGWLVLTFGAASLLLLYTVWGNTPEQWSGLKLYATAIVAFGIGRWLGQNLTENAALVLACTSLIVCGIQFLATLAQAGGILLTRPGAVNAETWISSGRMVGLYDHPSFLGKMMLLQLCFLLPLTTCSRDLTRRLANAAIIFGAVATLLTLARANIVAVGVAIAVWTVINNRAATIAVRLAIGGFVVGVLVAMNTGPIAALEARQLDDPNGGYRDSILEVGLQQINSALMTGTGPNYYTEVVGQYDVLASRGFPLHNSFLYPIAELGLPIGLLFFAPLIFAVGWAIRRIVRSGRPDAQSAALLAVVPGTVLVAWTGWGMISWEVLPAWFAAFGFLSTHNDIFVLSRYRDEVEEPAQPISQLTI